MYKNESIVRERKTPPCSVWTSFKCLQHKLYRPTIFCHFVTLHRVEKWCFRPTFSSISCFFFIFFPEEEETRKRDEGRRGDAVFWICVLRTCFKRAVVTVCAMCLTDSKKERKNEIGRNLKTTTTVSFTNEKGHGYSAILPVSWDICIRYTKKTPNKFLIFVGV